MKQELIEARAHKSASDDQLGNVSGKLETLENTITSLSDEGSHLNDVTIIQRFFCLGSISPTFLSGFFVGRFMPLF